MKTMEETEKPWRVVTAAGHFHSGHLTEAAAQARAESANKEAEALGIKARYEARES